MIATHRCIASVLMILALLWAGSGFATPLPADPTLDVTKLFQNDPAWENVKLDSSSRTIGDFGCTLTAWTMLINYEIVKAGLKEGGKAIAYTPAQINSLLNNYRSTNPKTNVTSDGWGVPLDKDGKPTGSSTVQDIGALLEAVQDDTKNRSDSKQGLVIKSYASDTGVDPKTGTVVDQNFAPLTDAITNGDPVVVRVNGQDTEGNTVPNGHSVLVIGLDATGNWVIADPFSDPNHVITTLSDPDYGNRIFAYDSGVFQAGGVSDPYSAPSPYDIAPADLYNPAINPYQYGFASYMINLGKISPVPEPATIPLVLAGLLALARRHRKNGGRRIR